MQVLHTHVISCTVESLRDYNDMSTLLNICLRAFKRPLFFVKRTVVGLNWNDSVDR